MENPIYLLDSGMALQLIHPTGLIADTIVYKNGPVDAEGWNGVSLSEPVSGIDNLILYRGDGCGVMTDTNQSADWHQRWGRLVQVISVVTYNSMMRHRLRHSSLQNMV